MKKLFLGLALLSFAACETSTVESEEISDMIKAESIEDFSCINQQADNPPLLSDAQTKIVGKWQLKGIISMMPATEIPNIKVEFKEDGGVFVTKDGENVYTDAYSVIEKTENGYTSIQVITDNLMDGFNENNIVKGTLRICDNEMMIDQGIAFDAPGYLFRKLSE